MTRLWPTPADSLRQRAPPRLVELGENVVEEEDRRDGTLGEQLRLAEQEREDRHALLALGAEAAQVTVAGENRDVVQMRAEPRIAPRSRSRWSRASSSSALGGSPW